MRYSRDIARSGDRRVRCSRNTKSSVLLRSAHNPETRVPPEVEAVVFRCLEKDPNRRPQTAEELLNEFVRRGRAGRGPRKGRLDHCAGETTAADRETPRPPLAALEAAGGTRRFRLHHGDPVCIFPRHLVAGVGGRQRDRAGENSVGYPQSPADRPFQRYFSLNHVDAAGALPATMDLDRRASPMRLTWFQPAAIQSPQRRSTRMRRSFGSTYACSAGTKSRSRF